MSNRRPCFHQRRLASCLWCGVNFYAFCLFGQRPKKIFSAFTHSLVMRALEAFAVASAMTAVGETLAISLAPG